MYSGSSGTESVGWAAKFVQARLYRSLTLYCSGAVVLIGFSVWLWFHTSAGTFRHEALAPTLLGSALTALAAFASLTVIATREIQERRQLNSLQNLPDSARPSLRIGNLKINDIRVIAAGDELERRFRFQVVSSTSAPLPHRNDPPEWPLIEETFLPMLQKRAKDRRQVFFDDQKLDLLDAVKRRDLEDGHPVTVYELTVGATNYFRFAAMSNALDEDMSGIVGGATTLRRLWGAEPLAPEHVAALQAPAAIGCGVVVATNDGQIVLLELAPTYVGGPIPGDRRTPVHIVAEGMIPADLATGRCPFRRAALRALDEELGIDVADAGLEPLAGLEMVGMFFDTQRWQPCFVWLARLSISLDELATFKSFARDGWETASLFGIPFDIRADRTRALLLGEHENLVASTNHASACLALALVANQGLVLCRAALSWSAGRGRRSQGPNFRMSEQAGSRQVL